MPVCLHTGKPVSPQEYPWSLSIYPDSGDPDSTEYQDMCREYLFRTREEAEAYAAQLSGFDCIVGAWQFTSYEWLTPEHQEPAFLPSY